MRKPSVRKAFRDFRFGNMVRRTTRKAVSEYHFWDQIAALADRSIKFMLDQNILDY